MKRNILIMMLGLWILSVPTAKAEDMVSNTAAIDQAEVVSNTESVDVEAPETEEIESKILHKEMSFYNYSISKLVREAKKNIRKIDKEIKLRKRGKK